VADCFKDNYANAPSDGKATSDVGGCVRVLRGGAWSSDPEGLRSASRNGDTPGGRSRSQGFRLARTL